MEVYIGLDVHRKACVFAAQRSDGAMICEGSVETSVEGLAQMAERCAAAAGTAVALETGTQAAWAADALRMAGLAPVIISAAEVRRKSSRRRLSPLSVCGEFCRDGGISSRKLRDRSAP